MKIVITGSNSFVGKYFQSILASDHELILLSSTAFFETDIPWQLTAPFPDQCRNANLFIHLAYDYSHSYFSNQRLEKRFSKLPSTNNFFS